MNAKLAGLGTVMLGLAAAASPAAAQLAANPVYYSPKAPTGLTLAADFGSTLSTKFGTLTASNKPNNIGVRATLGLPMVNVGVGGGIYNSDITGADKETQFMANAAVKVFSPPLVPLGIAVQAGAGYLQLGSGVGAAKMLNIPIGLAVAVKPPTPGMSVEPWAAPRVHLRRVSVSGNSAMQTGIGVSGGVNLGMPMGLGLHAALDWSKLSAKTSGTLNLSEVQTIVFGVGLHYTFTIPGLPIAPVI